MFGKVIIVNNVNIIAEIANAHQGDPDVAFELAEKSVQAGATSIKFQIYFSDEFMTTSHPRYQHFKEQEFSKQEWASLLSKAIRLDAEVYADIFGLEAYSVAESAGIDGYKLHSSDLNNTKLLDKLALQDKKVFLATGGSTVLEIRYALEKLIKYNRIPEIVMLHGFQAYPTKIEDSILCRIPKLKELFGDLVKIGYSDHIDGEDRFATILPLITIGYGVEYIEKHVTLDRSKKGVDYYSSYEPNQLNEFIKDVRLVQKSIGDNPLSFSASEKKYRNTVKKSWTTTKLIKSGSVIESSDIVMRRSNDFFSPPIYEEIIGSKVSDDIRLEGAVSRKLLNNKVLAIIVARSDSSRLPNKTTIKINGKPTISHLFERVKIAKERGIIDTIAFCTTTLQSEDQLVGIARSYPMKIYRGGVENVLSRIILAIDDNADHNVVLRITGDDILIDGGYLEKTINHHIDKNADYTDAKWLPSGTEVEVFDSHILKLIHNLAADSSGSEYLTNYITNNIDQFEAASLPINDKHKKHYRLTLDTKEDYQVIKLLLESMKEIGKEYDYTMDDIFNYFKNNSEVLEINRLVNQKATPVSVNTEIEWKNITKHPLVTVYITNYNYENFIRQSIDSVLNQKFIDYEVIIIDDGSTDKSRGIIETYRRHPKITIVYQENRGLNVSNNIAIKLSRGKYIVRLDADDYLNENALLVLSEKLTSDKSIALVFSDYYLVDASGSIIAEEKRHDFRNVTIYDQPAHGACTMIRKEILKEIGGYSEEFSMQDGYEIWIKIIKSRKVANINLPLFCYRQHEKSLTKNKAKLYKTRHKIVEKYADELNIREKKHIAIVPIRDSMTPPLCLEKFSDTTLLDITIKNIIKSKNINNIIVTTDNTVIVKYIINKYGNQVMADLRPSSLARMNTHLSLTVTYLMKEYKLDADTISIINYEYPLRDSYFIDKAINTMYLFNAQSVLSVTQQSDNFYMHQGGGMNPLNSNSALRLERLFVYKEAGGIHCVRSSYFKEYKDVVSNKSTHIIVDDHASKEIKTKDDFEYLEFLYKKKGLR